MSCYRVKMSALSRRNSSRRRFFGVRGLPPLSETTLLEGQSVTCATPLQWSRTVHPKIPLKRSDIRVDGSQLVAIGWSTGGTLALSLGWTGPANGVAAATGYPCILLPNRLRGPFWRQPNLPRGTERVAEGASYDVWEAVSEKPITGYNVASSKRAIRDGWPPVILDHGSCFI